jgi:hypothetical protein
MSKIQPSPRLRKVLREVASLLEQTPPRNVVDASPRTDSAKKTIRRLELDLLQIRGEVERATVEPKIGAVCEILEKPGPTRHVQDPAMLGIALGVVSTLDAYRITEGDIVLAFEAPPDSRKHRFYGRLWAALREALADLPEDAPMDRSRSYSDDALLPPATLAEHFGLTREAARKRLDRWRLNNDLEKDQGWAEQSNRKPRQPQYLYRLGSVRGILSASE